MVRVVVGVEECDISIHRYDPSSLLASLPLHLVSSFLKKIVTFLFSLLQTKLVHSLSLYFYSSHANYSQEVYCSGGKLRL